MCRTSWRSTIKGPRSLMLSQMRTSYISIDLWLVLRTLFRRKLVSKAKLRYNCTVIAYKDSLHIWTERVNRIVTFVDALVRKVHSIYLSGYTLSQISLECGGNNSAKSCCAFTPNGTGRHDSTICHRKKLRQDLTCAATWTPCHGRERSRGIAGRHVSGVEIFEHRRLTFAWWQPISVHSLSDVT